MFLKLKLLHDLLLNVQNVLQYGAYITHYYLIAKNHPILVIIFLVISSNAICFRFSFLNYISHFFSAIRSHLLPYYFSVSFQSAQPQTLLLKLS